MRKIALNNKGEKLSLKFKILITLIILFVLAAVIVFLIFFNTFHEYKTINVVPPTCQEMGYTETACIYCQKITRTNYTNALGHDFGEKILEAEATETEFGKETESCSRCQVKNVYSIEPTSTMKKFYYSGDTFQIDEDVSATGVMTYSYNGEKVEKEIKMKYITFRRSRAIKNDLLISFYDDKEYTQEAEMKLMDDMQASSEWYFYGNFFDFHNLRDSVTNDLYREVRSTSTAIDSRLKDNYGTCKSEPVLMYFNETFAGVFQLVEPTTNRTFNMAEDDKNCAIVRANVASGQSYFTTEITKSGAFEVLYNSEQSEDEQNLEQSNEWIYNSLNNLSTFIQEADDKQFKSKISDYLDVDGMIDYMLTVYNTGAADNVARAFTLATYDGKVWTPSIYDANASLGMDNDGEISTLDTTLAPSYDTEQKKYDPDVNSALWDRMLNCFYDKIKDRYYQLKDTVFSPENIYKKFEKYKKLVPDSVYDAEAKKYDFLDSKIDLKTSIADFIAARKNIFNVFFEGE